MSENTIPMEFDVTVERATTPESTRRETPIPIRPKLPKLSTQPRATDTPLHCKGSPAQFDLDILRVVYSSVNAAHQLLNSRPQGDIRPILTPGHNHYARLALLPTLRDLAAPYLTDDEVALLTWAQQSVYYEILLRRDGQHLPMPSHSGLRRLRRLIAHLRTSIDTLSVAAGMKNTTDIRKGSEKQFGRDTAAQYSGAVALV